MNTTIDTAVIVIFSAFVQGNEPAYRRFLGSSGRPTRFSVSSALAILSAKGSRPSFPFRIRVGTVTGVTGSLVAFITW
ncbi:hypothetical protein [Spirosoma areae]